MESRGVCMVSVAVMVLAMAAMAPEAAAQASPSTECALKLIDCRSFLSTTTTPAATCCNTIKDLVEKELTCLCGLLTNRELLKNVGVNVTQALDVPRRCGMSSGTGLCNSSTSPTTTHQRGEWSDGTVTCPFCLVSRLVLQKCND
ncbi:hypothetical protein Taro_041815 [Colocasia esculenta]|uniref:Bifunctional inhibitor/plant lipid transfer protein/seed storage helical domain-containing protein n=1 Tax=Colocasia esculenta TaxID=4460 RepID=A0A843WME8_COLES|nr:hypothetical protein [Colocasia esculenta]